MQDKSSMTIRFIGLDYKRMYTIQRGDLRFWAGDNWSLILDKAKVFHDHGAAATTLAALQYQQYKGLPVRALKMELDFPTKKRTKRLASDIVLYRAVVMGHVRCRVHL